MSIEWNKILLLLRESGEEMLHAVCSNLADVYFTDDTIEITCPDDTTFKLLTKHRARLGGYVNIHKQKPSALMTKPELIEKLGSIFGNKLTVQK